MLTYRFTNTLLKKSRKKINIYDSNEEVIGSTERYFHNKLEYIVDNIFDETFVHIKVFDHQGDLIAIAKEENSFFRQKWLMKTDDGKEFQLIDRTKIKTNPRLAFTIDHDHYTLEKDFGDKVTRIKSNGQVVSEIFYRSLIPPLTIYINCFSTKLDIYTIICIYRVFSLKY